jgi:hypothetical protein
MSHSDQAFARFTQLHRGNDLLSRHTGDLSETDTRVKLIDPIFKEVLGWTEQDIRREEPASEGFADYVFGAEFPHFHVEAKRSTPRFDLQAPGRDRYLKLSGPHLLGRRDMKLHLEQTAKYAPDLGTDFAVLTNGDQFIIFQTRVHGQSWREGYAIVYHDHEDIIADFAGFYALLSADTVRGGSLLEMLSATGDSITEPHYRALEYIYNPDAELVRNHFWTKIARVVGPLLTDDPQAMEIQDEIIRNCYVRTPLSDEADGSIHRLLEDKPSAQLRNADVIDLKLGMGGRTAFDHAIERDIKAHHSGAYILTGGVGSGKTTFLRRFERVVAQSFVKEWCVWLHVDYLAVGDVRADHLDVDLSRYTFARIREIVEQQYPTLWPRTGEELRGLFAAQIQDATITKLHGIEPGSERWNLEINELVHTLFNNSEVFAEALLRRLARDGRRVVLVLDNTDQLGEAFQHAVFLLSQRLARSCIALTIVALREEKFFAAFRRGVFDAYGDRRFHIGSPNLEHVIRLRLEYAARKYANAPLAHAEDSSDAALERDERTQVKAVIDALIRSATKRNQNIVRLLSCVSNGDMRHALGMFREFISSGNTDIEKILRIVKEDGGYTVPFHEFAKSAILGSRRYYHNNLSHVINLFTKSASAGASHLMALRILARLAAGSAAPSARGEGFIDTEQLLSEARQSFGRADDFVARAQELLARGLLESEPPRSSRIQESDALRVSASGMYYFKYLVRAFAYLDLVFVDTPLRDRELAYSLARLAQNGTDDFEARFDRVRAFLDYLGQEDSAEIGRSIERSGPYVECLVPAIRDQIEQEIQVIKQKRKRNDGPVVVPHVGNGRRRRRSRH